MSNKKQNNNEDEKCEGLSNQSPFSKLKQSEHCNNVPQSYEQSFETLTALLRKDGICGLLKLANKFKVSVL
jgi:hypothetical protein